VSDRLDIVRLIDAKVTSTRRTVTRSKQLAEAARGDLHIHEDWLRQHRERSEEDLRRHRHRMKRQQRFQTFKSVMVSVVLFAPRLCVSLYRGVASSLRTLDELFFSGCAWAGRTAYAFCSSLIGLLSGGLGRIGAKTLTLGLALAAALWLMLSSLGKGAFTLGLALIGTTSRGLAWLGPRASNTGQKLIASLSMHLNRLATEVGGLGLEIGSGTKRQASHLGAVMGELGLKLGSDTKRQASHLVTRLRTRAAVSHPKPVPALDPGRLQQAAFIRLRAEHDRLQARIHAMDRRYEQRQIGRAHANARDWVELRKLALNARRLLEVQERQVLGQAEFPRNGASPPLQVAPAASRASSAHPLSAGHAIYEAPATMAGHRRA
jgi:hypothetical protein